MGVSRIDLVVDGSVLLEPKAGPQLAAPHRTQLLNYLRASGLPVGLLLNFGSQPTIQRLIPNGA